MIPSGSSPKPIKPPADIQMQIKFAGRLVAEEEELVAEIARLKTMRRQDKNLRRVGRRLAVLRSQRLAIEKVLAERAAKKGKW